ncbi:MAG TPA: NADPH:quinone reductase [Candidatus Baltobacteraceae bacterium]|jgi:NADPH:quinone reductase|nr:NADPH:quinone reductase [Candidatus Baltobacteraceae bacterium]
MKAIRVHQFGGPEVLRLEDVADPKPAAGQVLVRIHAAGVNPVETYVRAGAYARLPSLPYTPGTDAGGTIESTGPNVSRFKPGDRVYTIGALTGAYGELALCDERTVFPLPAAASFAQGAAVGVPYGTAFRALFVRAQAHGGETVLIHGASGGVGIATVQLARAAGLHVVGTAGSDRGKKLVLDEGAHKVLDHTSLNHFDEALATTGGRGYDLIIEMLSNVNLGRDLPMLAPKGRVVAVGSRGPVEINPRDTMSRDATILGMSLLNASIDELTGIHAAIGAGLENRTLRPIVGQEIPLAEAARAHKAVMESGAYGKIVLVP